MWRDSKVEKRQTGVMEAPLDRSRPLDRLIAEGLVTPAPAPKRARSGRNIRTNGTVSDLVADQRRCSHPCGEAILERSGRGLRDPTGELGAGRASEFVGSSCRIEEESRRARISEAH